MIDPSDTIGRLDPVGGRAIPHDVKKAVGHMRVSLRLPMTMGALVKVCGVPERTLHKHFRVFLGVSPLAFWRRLRLAAVREQLLAAADGESVSKVAMRHGFEHFGRFSAQYRRCFGESPSCTLRRARITAVRAAGESGSAVGSDQRRVLRLATVAARERPSVVVLPFAAPASTAEQSAFAESLAEGIATALTHVRALAVVAPLPKRLTSQYSVSPVARFGARYCIIGKATLAGDRVRVIVRLVDAATERQLWGDTYDGEVTDPFGLQDRVTEGVVCAIVPNIRGAEIERARQKQRSDLDAYDLTMRALPFAFAANPDAARQALDLLHRAMEIDHDYALPAALAAWCHAQLITHNGTQSPAEEKAHALRLIQRAAILGADDPLVVTAQCAVYTMIGEHDTAAILLERALAVDPTSAWAWERSGWLKTYIGEVDTAIRHFQRAIQLDVPHSPNASRFIGIGCAHFDAGRYEAGAFWMRRATVEQPGTVWVNRTLSVSYARMGEQIAARDSLEALLRYRPDLTIAQVVGALPFRRGFMDRVAEGLDDLGLPP
jgi:TolB-like protein/AraC-like DNA-binding protein/tetratricopeptide (TPR) repeat protein